MPAARDECLISTAAKQENCPAENNPNNFGLADATLLNGAAVSAARSILSSALATDEHRSDPVLTPTATQSVAREAHSPES